MTLSIVVAETAMGFAGVALSEKGIRRATLFLGSHEAVVRDLNCGSDYEAGPRGEEITALLKAYADGSASLDTYPVDVADGTEFQRMVWLALRDVTRGETRSYAWLTKRLGLPPSAARAVGAANAANRVPLWLPCHRIIGSDGSLHGFAGGLAMKRALLELEGALPRALV